VCLPGAYEVHDRSDGRVPLLEHVALHDHLWRESYFQRAVFVWPWSNRVEVGLVGAHAIVLRPMKSRQPWCLLEVEA
jgi:hypothetical protein